MSVPIEELSELRKGLGITNLPSVQKFILNRIAEGILEHVDVNTSALADALMDSPSVIPLPKSFVVPEINKPAPAKKSTNVRNPDNPETLALREQVKAAGVSVEVLATNMSMTVGNLYRWFKMSRPDSPHYKDRIDTVKTSIAIAEEENARNGKPVKIVPLPADRTPPPPRPVAPAGGAAAAKEIMKDPMRYELEKAVKVGITHKNIRDVMGLDRHAFRALAQLTPADPGFYGKLAEVRKAIGVAAGTLATATA